MTRYRVRHITHYRYGSPVRFARCNLRLTPVDWDGQQVERHAIEIEPAATLRPGPRSGYLVNTNRAVVIKPAAELTIESSATILVTRVAPVAAPDDPTVAEAAAAARAVSELGVMAPANFLYPSPRIDAFPQIAAWCAEELRATRGIVEAGLALSRRIKQDFRYDGSATEFDTSPADAFAARHGVCQDFAQVMISGARSLGIAAAYVSGYLRTLPPPGRPRLVGADATHAWVLLWCGPARGWLGFDPTNGVTMGGDHIVTAIGRDYGDVSPVDGIFLGRGSDGLSVSVDVEPLD